jgi:uncharacterized protein (DUF1778 family)
MSRRVPRGARARYHIRVDNVTTIMYIHCMYRKIKMASPTKAERTGSTINLRIDKRKRALIDRAAQRLGKNRSEFMLEVACREATTVLLDQRLFMLDDKTYRRFTDALDKAPSENPRLRRLLTARAPWER